MEFVDPQGPSDHAGSQRRFALPWRVEELESCFVVRDADGTSLAYVYFARGARLSAVPGSLAEEDARRLARWFADSPRLRGRAAEGSQESSDEEARRS